jgi:probable HAF family extracellular repeat protein
MNKLALKLSLVIALTLSAQSANAASYTFTDLGNPLIGNSSAFAINNFDLVAGIASTTGVNSGPEIFATLWSASGATLLGTPEFGIKTRALAINNFGQVAGYSQSSVGIRATIWDGASTTYLDTGAPIGTQTHAFAINNFGQVAGDSFNASDSTLHAVVWNGTTTNELGSLGGSISQAFGINSSGQVVGLSDTADNSGINLADHATLWDGNAVIDLDPFGAHSQANAINDFSQIVGWSSTSVGNRHATLWNGTTMTELGLLGGDTSEAHSINNAGLVAGFSSISDNGEIHATLWENGTVTDLNSFLDIDAVNAGWVLTQANGINDNGSIVGIAYNSKLSPYVFHPFLLTQVTAVPEPDTYAMFLAGLGIMGFVARRRRNGQS